MKGLKPSEALAQAVQRAALSMQSHDLPLAQFVREGWPEIEPATELQWNWHHDLIMEYLESAFNGQIKRLVINVPPRSLKSNFISVLWPAWGWTRKPWSRWIFSSYAQTLSTDFSVKRRRVIESDWYKERWGNLVKLQEDENQKTSYVNDQMGAHRTTSTGGAITGKGGDFIVIDDPQNPKMAESEVERKTANEHYSQTLVSRLDSKKKGVIVIVMQRLHRNDLTGHVLQEGGFTHIDIQAKADARRSYTLPISKKEVVVHVNEHLQLEREGDAEFESLRRAMGTRAHDAQYQQRPTSETGNLWKRHWWKFYQVVPEGFDLQLLSWDLAFKKGDDTSFVVGQCWGLRGADAFLLDQVRARLDYPETKRAFLAFRTKWPRAFSKLVEDKANGPALISELQRTVPGIIACEPDGDKVVRASVVSPMIESGNVFLPHPSICALDDNKKPWIEAFVEECSAFPDSDHNDQVDCTSQALSRIQELIQTGGVGKGEREVEEEVGDQNFLEGTGGIPEEEEVLLQ